MNIEKWKALRRHLHAHPETAFEELDTASTLREHLDTLGGWNLHKPIGKTGVLAVLDSARPGPSIMLRAELDALPIEERSDRPHRSLNAGKGHLCGHDGHATILLALADRLVVHPPAKGRVYLLFQPAEETGAGAQAVLDDPAFEEVKPDWVFGLHNLPGRPMHQVVLRNGYFNASVCSMIVRLQGDTAHAAEPANGRNPADVLARVLQLPQSMNQPDTRRSDFRIAAAVYARLGSMAYGTSAGDGEIHFTLRAWQEEALHRFTAEMEERIHSQAKRAGLDCDIEYTEIFHAIRNVDAAVAQVAAAATSLGLDVHYEEDPFTWGEDFGRFTAMYQGAFFGIGAGENTAALHRPDYDFPDELLLSAPLLFHRLIDHIHSTA
jgi:amidohydrolase